jgi:hypothetical protein
MRQNSIAVYKILLSIKNTWKRCAYVALRNLFLIVHETMRNNV